MAIRRILTAEDKSLLKHSRRVELFNRHLHNLLDDMRDTLREANGAGLAAVQVGVLRRVCVVQTDEDEDISELINPEIIGEEGEQEGPEGCLSVPGVTGLVKRPQKVTIKAQDRHGKPIIVEAEGLKARAMCHEIDHLDGVLYTCHVLRYLTDEEVEEMNKK
ncbi:MAG: peptide deformylase [Oscillospiraceae bacterium]|jgi:peptide deformylase|nr:peptide deformylase [Oscillospiraceae bacterium]